MNQFEYIDATQGTNDQQIIDIAREWVKDVVYNPEEVDGASDTAIRRYVKRYYEGGWDQFLKDCVGE